MTYPPWRTRRTLTKGAVFDRTLPTPVTYLELGSDVPDGPITVEFWRTLGLMTESLLVGDQIELEYESFWAHRNYDRSQELGQYQERLVATTIHWQSRPPPNPLRVPPLPKAEWGPFELAAYSQLLRSVKGF
jgi:hypothetical protein